ncbi:MAG: YlxR family protein [Nitriliruptoraceae bacterium]
MSRGSRPRGRDATGGAPRRPVRTCVVCRATRPQDELLRVVVRGAALTEDPGSRLGGRGAYLCPRTACLQGAGARDGAALRRALRAPGVDVGPALARLRAAHGDATDGATAP